MSLHTDFKARAIETIEFGNDKVYELVLVEPSVFSGRPVERRIRLYTSNFETKQFDPAVAERTQNTLRTVLGDNNIIFTRPEDKTEDPNHIENWLKTHPDAPVSAVTFNPENQRFYLGEVNLNGSSRPNDLPTFRRRNKNLGANFDIDNEYMSITEGFPQSLLTQINNLTGPNIPEPTKSGFTFLNFQGEVVNVVAEGDYDTRPKDGETKATRKELIEQLAAVLAMSPQTVEALKALPAECSYLDIKRTLVEQRDRKFLDETGFKLAETIIKAKAHVLTLRFYYKLADSPYVFRSGATVAGTFSLWSFNQGLTFEALDGDVCEKDVADFLLSLNLPTNELNEILNQSPSFKDGKLTFERQSDVVRLLNKAVVGRTIHFQMTLKSQRRGIVKHEMLSATPQSIGGKVVETPTPAPAPAVEPAVATPEPAPQVVEPVVEPAVVTPEPVVETPTATPVTPQLDLSNPFQGFDPSADEMAAFDGLGQ